MELWRVMHTDNYGGDYPNEKFVEQVPRMNRVQAEELATLCNRLSGNDAPRFYKAVPESYKLQPGFEP